MNIAIIVAAGRGTRMGGAVDKLFLELAGAPVIAHTWRQFERCPEIAELVFVTRPESRDAFRAVAAQQGFQKPYHFADGGRERQDSVWNGLQAAPAGTALVAIHDGARPCVTPALIAAVLAAARETGAAVAASRLTDTIKESDDDQYISRHLERDRLWAVQTPQAFRWEVIRRAIATAREQSLVFTDDTAACRLIAQPVRLVASETPNPKVTAPHDLPAIERLLRA